MLIDIVGYFGLFFVVCSYLALTRNWITNGVLYQTMNGVGSTCLLVNAIALRAIPLSIIQILCICIAISWFITKGKPNEKDSTRTLER